MSKEDMKKINDDMVQKILEYLKTGVLEVSGTAFSTAYR